MMIEIYSLLLIIQDALKDIKYLKAKNLNELQKLGNTDLNVI